MTITCYSFQSMHSKRSMFKYKDNGIRGGRANTRLCTSAKQTTRRYLVTKARLIEALACPLQGPGNQNHIIQRTIGREKKMQVRGTLIQGTFAWFCDQKNNRLQVVWSQCETWIFAGLVDQVDLYSWTLCIKFRISAQLICGKTYCESSDPSRSY